MNSINFSQVGGFPMTTNILGKMQTAYSLFNAFGNIVGDKTIISGCDVTGSNTSNGVVFINGEVFEFRGGLTQSKVLIKEESESLLFQNNNAYPVVKNRYVQFGTGVGAIDWVDFKRGFQTKGLQALFTEITTSLTTINTKLATIATNADVSLQPDYAQDDNTKKDFIKNKPAGTFLYKGTYPIGDVAGYDDSRTITFPTVGTANYMVLGTLVSKGAEGYDNDIRFVIKDNRTATGFVILLGDSNGGGSTGVQNLEFDYILIAK